MKKIRTRKQIHLKYRGRYNRKFRKRFIPVTKEEIVSSGEIGYLHLPIIFSRSNSRHGNRVGKAIDKKYNLVHK